MSTTLKNVVWIGDSLSIGFVVMMDQCCCGGVAGGDGSVVMVMDQW
jgi:hypothetical protein